MAGRQHTHAQRQLAEQRLLAGEPAAAVSRDLQLSERSVVRWRDALGVAPKPRGFPRGKARKMTSGTVEPDFASWVAALGKHFTDLEALATSDTPNLLTRIARGWRKVQQGDTFKVGGAVTEPAAALSVGGVIGCEATQALTERAFGKDWATIGRDSLLERALPATEAAATAEGQRLRGEVSARVAILSEGERLAWDGAGMRASELAAGCQVVSVRLLGERLEGASVRLWRDGRLRDHEAKRKTRQP